ncbi:UDP-N-acetylglucosamine--N-acetylmuramyl-(pentapeptide) pyrophosphoryl-undecaprenol N-acetylglucosamine transferase [Campylobacter sp. MG1]|uniref:UDP-N-acetylglucosamine--N-acetylmuramyl- (pentapeptide) pyrophosphoryl-undecaprenol N-acetylglucosamine transferase n=1 Tax=Campylobacter sp. MG1 TaxID=2976332 RepID=UPI00226D1726|nr:UDP-N-acetylglucosamine--N-acetylmuramyl-(pentapeptide) pyrophosphoryl-undecaprenol N-acetylglucosamine transferase [Campylobacter sp. MG1]
MILITGGGTGGHLAVAKAVANNLDDFVYIGSTKGQDSLWFSGEKCYFLKSSGFVNQGIFGKIKVLFSLLVLVYECLKIFKKHKISCVFSVGGYSSVPASLAAIISFKKLIIHEQNSKIGLANKILKPFAYKFFSAYEKELCPYPIQNIYKQLKRKRTEIKTVLILGGSQGARFLNDFALELYPELLKLNINLIHQCGAKEYDKYEKEYSKFDKKPILIGFSKEIYKYMREADFCISRAGASASFELVNIALPTLFVPYKYAYKNHQYYNALYLVDKKLAFLCEEKDINVDKVLNLIMNDALKYSSNLFDLDYDDGALLLANILKGLK